jgi:hypothetical protein
METHIAGQGTLVYIGSKIVVQGQVYIVLAVYTRVPPHVLLGFALSAIWPTLRTATAVSSFLCLKIRQVCIDCWKHKYGTMCQFIGDMQSGVEAVCKLFLKN